MNIYYLKYLKYKKKYIKLKNQIAGEITDLEGWTNLKNPGFLNCGIFINDEHPSELIKCTNSLQKNIIRNVNNINSIFNLFPRIIDTGEFIYEGRMRGFVKMNRLNGNINDLLYTLVPNHVIDTMIRDGKCSSEIKENILRTFNSKKGDDRIKINKSKLKQGMDEITTQNLDSLLEFMIYDIDLYKDFIINLYILYNEILPIIVKEITIMFILLLSVGYGYTDFKFDNFGYILSETNLEDDFRKGEDVPKILGKFIYIYILDWDTGFKPLIRLEEFRSTLDSIVSRFRLGMDDFLTRLNHNLFSLDVSESDIAEFIGYYQKYNPIIGLMKYVNPFELGDWISDFRERDMFDILGSRINRGMIEQSRIDTIIAANIKQVAADTKKELEERQAEYDRVVKEILDDIETEFGSKITELSARQSEIEQILKKATKQEEIDLLTKENESITVSLTKLKEDKIKNIKSRITFINRLDTSKGLVLFH